MRLNSEGLILKKSLFLPEDYVQIKLFKLTPVGLYTFCVCYLAELWDAQHQVPIKFSLCLNLAGACAGILFFSLNTVV